MAWSLMGHYDEIQINAKITRNTEPLYDKAHNAALYANHICFPLYLRQLSH